MKTIDIDLPANGYPVYVGRGLLAQGAFSPSGNQTPGRG